jgi:GTPase SAR1 family protein
MAAQNSANGRDDAPSHEDPSPPSPLFVPRETKIEQQFHMLDSVHDSEHSTLGNDASRQTHLTHILISTWSEQLERAVDMVMGFLRDLATDIREMSDLDAETRQKWTRDIAALLDTPKHRTVIGVVGGSGCGKSSAINAILKEAHLVEISNSRACTNWVTEISWNKSDDESKLYRGQIEYISAEEWREELAILVHDLLDENGEYGPLTMASNIGQVALAKIRSVYGDMEPEVLAVRLRNIGQMAQDDGLKNLLGTVEEFGEPNEKSFCARLRECTSNAKGLWPLIKVVRIFLKAEVLKSGVVIVDLPGAQDSNVARSAVAENYIKECSGIWIFADIVRAVTDKTAKELLGDSFRRQLVLDGMCSDVTFIYTKTDVIGVEWALSEYPIPGINSCSS